jgi:hypothetical protein
MPVSTKLFVAESSPEVPTRYGTEGAPSLSETLNITRPAIGVLDGSFKPDVPQGKHVRFPKDHDAEH